MCVLERQVQKVLTDKDDVAFLLTFLKEDLNSILTLTDYIQRPSLLAKDLIKESEEQLKFLVRTAVRELASGDRLHAALHPPIGWRWRSRDVIALARKRKEQLINPYATVDPKSFFDDKREEASQWIYGHRRSQNVQIAAVLSCIFRDKELVESMTKMAQPPSQLTSTLLQATDPMLADWASSKWTEMPLNDDCIPEPVRTTLLKLCGGINQQQLEMIIGGGKVSALTKQLQTVEQHILDKQELKLAVKAYVTER